MTSPKTSAPPSTVFTLKDRQQIPSFLLSRPRRVRPINRTGGCAVLFIRLFMLPHTLIGLALIVAAVFFPAWVLFGTNHHAQVLTAVRKLDDSRAYEVNCAYTVNGQERRETHYLNEKEFIRIGGASTTQPAEGVEQPRYGQILIRSIGTPPLFHAAAIDPAESLWAGYIGLLLFALLWNGLLSFFLGMLYVRPWRLRQLYRWGEATVGVITRLPAEGKEREDPYVEYDFAVDATRVAHDKIIPSLGINALPLAVGQRVTVLCVSGKHPRSIVYELGPFRCD